VVFRGEIAAREHQQLLECALARDAKRAQAILVSHIDGCVEDALRNDAAGVFRNQEDRVSIAPSLKGGDSPSPKKRESGPARKTSRSIGKG
jgi:hypothetical protein